MLAVRYAAVAARGCSSAVAASAAGSGSAAVAASAGTGAGDGAARAKSASRECSRLIAPTNGFLSHPLASLNFTYFFFFSFSSF